MKTVSSTIITRSRLATARILTVLFISVSFAACDQRSDSSSNSKSNQAFDKLIGSLEAQAQEKNLAAIKAGNVRVGMTKVDVTRSLGSPESQGRASQELRQTVEEIWQYRKTVPEGADQSNPTNAMGYDIILPIGFDYDGKVVAVPAQLDFDKQPQ